MASELQQKDPANHRAEIRGGNKKWADLFRGASKPSTSFQLRKWSEDERVIAKEELRDLGFCLVGYVLGRFPGRHMVESVQKSWNVQSSCSLQENGWMLFRFDSAEDRDMVLLKGPFETFGSPWLLKKLPSFFSFKEISFTSVPIWIRLPGLPLECWSEIALGKLASFVGDPIAADECTASMAKSSYARILVEVDMTKPLVREISVRLPDGSELLQDVIYEREPQLCSKCNRLGHNEEQCRANCKRPQNVKQHRARTILQTAKDSEEQSTVKMQQQILGSTASVDAAECATPQSAMEVQGKVDMQGVLPSTPANPIPVTQRQKQVVHSDARQPTATVFGKPMLLQTEEAYASSLHIGNKLLQDTELQATLAPAMAAELGSPNTAIKGQRMVDLQGEASTPANPSAATQLQNLRLKLAADHQLNATAIQTARIVEPISTAKLVADQEQEQIPKEAKPGEAKIDPALSKEQSTKKANTLQRRSELQGPSFSTPAEVVSPQLANMVQRLVDLQGEASTPANPTAVSKQIQGRNFTQVQQKVANVFQDAPANVQESQTFACHRVVGQFKEQIPEQTRRQTRNSSAAIAAAGAAMQLQTSQQGPPTNAEALLDDQSKLKEVDAANSVPQTQKNKWQTPKSKKGKKR